MVTDLYFAATVLFILPNVCFSRVCDVKLCPRLDCNEPVDVAGECCPRCPCPQGKYHYAVGDIVRTNDTCKTCECMNWGIVCLPIPCSDPECPNPVLREGECCPECGCLEKNCFFEIGEAMPIPKNDPCITDCRCGIEGKIVCKRTTCPAAFFCFHTVTIPGECCPKCGCLHGENQTFYNTGAVMPVEDDDPCFLGCRCGLTGQRVCARMECPVPDCAKPLHVSGECCAKCGCLHEETQTVYDFGQEVPATDNHPCTMYCRCTESGAIVCDQMECPILKCPDPVTLAGECCPQCGCIHGEKETFYAAGAVMPLPDEPCLEGCHCDTDGKRVCEAKNCPSVDCTENVTLPGECCPSCRNLTEEKQKHTEAKQVVYSTVLPVPVEDDADGNIVCRGVECPEVTCSNSFTRPGECCPICGCTVGKNHTFYELGVVSEDPCEVCECHEDGTVSCIQKMACPKLRCKYGKFQPEGECCSQCKCRYKRQIKYPGEVFGPDCSPCTCNPNGKFTCDERPKCPKILNCTDPRTKSGECCPSCPKGPNCKIGRTVIPYGQYKKVGSKVCICAGETWYPDAFCATKEISYSLSKNFNSVLAPYGYKAPKKL